MLRHVIDYRRPSDRREQIFHERGPWADITPVCGYCGGTQHEAGCMSDAPIRARQAGKLVGDTTTVNLRHDLIGWHRVQKARADSESRPSRLRRLLGTDLFAPEPASAQEPEDRMLTIGRLARMLDRKPATVRDWIA